MNNNHNLDSGKDEEDSSSSSCSPPPSYEAAVKSDRQTAHKHTASQSSIEHHKSILHLNHRRQQSDNDVRVAAEALEALRTTSSPDSSGPIEVPTISESTNTDNAAADDEKAEEDPLTKNDSSYSSFLSRVGSTAMSSVYKVYASGKTYSPRFRHSAEKIEAVVLPDYSENTNHIRKRNHHHHHHHHHHHRLNSRNNCGNSSSSTAATTTAKRPMWQDVLVSATSLTQLSSESRQRLRYCLNLLKLANTRLADTVNKLQYQIQKETANRMAQSIAAENMPHNSNEEETIAPLKQDLITTIKKILTVVTTFAGNSLPEPARSHVKKYILQLPSNWVLSVNSTPVTTTPPPELAASEDNSNNDSSLSPDSSNHSDDDSKKNKNTKDEIESGSRVLNLAQETLEMLGNIISVVDDTLERAEYWCPKDNTTTNEKKIDESNNSEFPLDHKIQLDDY